MKSLFLFLLVFTGFVSSGLHAQMEELPTITEALTEDTTTSTLHAALEAADLLTILDEEDSIHLLAPTNDAFAALPDGLVEKLLNPRNAEALRALLGYHLVAAGDEAEATLIGKLTADGAEATEQTECSNGTIHRINQVLLPPGFDTSTLVD